MEVNIFWTVVFPAAWISSGYVVWLNHIIEVGEPDFDDLILMFPLAAFGPISILLYILISILVSILNRR